MTQRSRKDVFILEVVQGRKFALAPLGLQRDPLTRSNVLLSPSLASTQGMREEGSKCGGEKNLPLAAWLSSWQIRAPDRETRAAASQGFMC